ncbi:TonB-dependent receptor [Lysobacter arseniciresistens ZS79]|uniref:TonB-dependent receptor n=1 Tax=Lysobacter arseniciresistens ZS79 TaxID=913325 RepID=A0A0A0ETS8_9GAMM|nr:TonB-dependent copper receptor [Lysobacter arseniciresistens]KGM53533.1 TonB-dependent receptor [Lysobacter arseniciresistens ZS79]
MTIPRTPAIRLSRLSASLLLVLATPSVLAASPENRADPPAAFDLDAIVVTAAAPVSALTFDTSPKLPRQPVPASDGADYLKTIPGFSAVRNGGTNGDPVLRGMFGSRLNLLTNDGAMPGACPSRMDNAMSYVSPETYDRLVVTKGPQTVLWGPGASAGTVRFERDREYFADRTFKFAGSLLGGSFGRNDQVLDATLGDRIGYARISANRSHSDDYEDGNGDTVGSAWEKWNSDLALAWTPDDSSVLELGIGRGDGESRYATRGMDGSRFKRENHSLRYEKDFDDGALQRIEASMFHNVADHVMDNYSLREPNPDGPMPMPMASNVERSTGGGRLAATWRGGAYELVAGIDGQDSRHRRRGGMGRGAYKAQPWTVDARFASLGGFAEGTYFQGERNRWVAGARIDRAEATDERATVSGGHGGHAMPNPTAGRTREETLAAGFVRFERDAASQPLTWYAGLGHTERMPDYWELFSARALGGDTGMGGPNAFAGLDTEKTTQLDIGLHYRGRKVDAWVSAYAGRVDDFIQFRYPAEGMLAGSSIVSNIDAEIRGAELGVELRPAEHWKLGGTLAYARGEDADSGRPLPQMTPLESRLTASWDSRQWTAGALVRVVDGQDRVAPGHGNVVGQDLGPSPGFATLALNAGYRFDNGLQLTAGVDNVFDRAYSEHLNLAGNADFGYPADPVRINEPGRTAWLKLNYTY